jgi:hypothetical protein
MFSNSNGGTQDTTLHLPGGVTAHRFCGGNTIFNYLILSDRRARPDPPTLHTIGSPIRQYVTLTQPFFTLTQPLFIPVTSLLSKQAVCYTDPAILHTSAVQSVVCYNTPSHSLYQWQSNKSACSTELTTLHISGSPGFLSTEPATLHISGSPVRKPVTLCQLSDGIPGEIGSFQHTDLFGRKRLFHAA